MAHHAINDAAQSQMGVWGRRYRCGSCESRLNRRSTYFLLIGIWISVTNSLGSVSFRSFL